MTSKKFFGQKIYNSKMVRHCREILTTSFTTRFDDLFDTFYDKIIFQTAVSCRPSRSQGCKGAKTGLACCVLANISTTLDLGGLPEASEVALNNTSGIESSL